MLREHLAVLLRAEAPLVDRDRARRLLDELLREVDGLGPLDPLLADPDVTEIMVNGPGRAYVERAGRLVAVDLGLDGPEIARLAERIVAPLGLRLDRSSPIADARLADGSRVHAVLAPLAPDGPCLTIRRFATRPVGLAAFDLGSDGEAFVRSAVRGGWNLLVAGATSAGKTTLLNALSAAIDPENGSSRSRRRPSCGSRNLTSCAWRRAPRTPKAPARSACAISCAARCACVPTASSSARFAAARPSTCCRRSTPVTTAHSRRFTPTARRRVEPVGDARPARRPSAAAGRGPAPDRGRARRGRVRRARSRRRPSGRISGRAGVGSRSRPRPRSPRVAVRLVRAS